MFVGGGAMSSYSDRFAQRKDELEWLYKETYGDNRWYLDQLEHELCTYAKERPLELRHRDEGRERQDAWYLDRRSLFLKMDAERFCGTLGGLVEKIPYFKELGITMVRLEPIFKKGEQSGLITDFDQVEPALGTIKDVEHLAAALRLEGIDLCLEFPLEATSPSHTWALLAKNGSQEFRSRYFVFSDRKLASRMESAAGNCIWNDELHAWIYASHRQNGWDLDYHNPVVLNEMVFSLCRWMNKGVDAFHLGGIPLLWKEPDTTCTDLPRVHTLLRIIRLSLEIVNPCICLCGEAGESMSLYFGTRTKPECHLMEDQDLAANLWSALASQDARLLRMRVEDLLALPSHCVFTASLGGNGTIIWNLNAEEERKLGMDEVKHRLFLFQFFGGTFPSSYSRGRLCHYDPIAKTGQNCGTPASLCGIESALEEEQGIALARAIQRYVLLESTLMALRGVPALTSGEEIAEISADLLGRFDWEKAGRRTDKRTVEGRVFSVLGELVGKRNAHGCFDPDATVTTWDAQNNHVLAIRRTKNGRILLCVSNFSDSPQPVKFAFFIGMYRDVFTSRVVSPGWGFVLQPLEYVWLEPIETFSILDAKETAI